MPTIRPSWMHKYSIKSICTFRILFINIKGLLLMLVFCLCCWEYWSLYTLCKCRWRLIEFESGCKCSEEHVILEACLCFFGCGFFYLFDIFEFILLKTCKDFKISIFLLLFWELFCLNLAFIFVLFIEICYMLFYNDFIIWCFALRLDLSRLKIGCPSWFLFRYYLLSFVKCTWNSF
jgi:hypothetical protein